jgi:hypothetical protein
MQHPMDKQQLSADSAEKLKRANQMTSQQNFCLFGRNLVTE